VSKLDDELQAEQTKAAADSAAEFFRSLVRQNPEVKVRQLSRQGLETLAVLVISGYELKRAEQARVHSSRLIESSAPLGI
jgi:hypothetical protein